MNQKSIQINEQGKQFKIIYKSPPGQWYKGYPGAPMKTEEITVKDISDVIQFITKYYK